MGLAAKLPALPTAAPKQGGTLDSKKADIYPWEVGHAPLAKTEICPWEEPATPSGKERLSQDTCGISGSRGPDDMKAKLAAMGGCQSENRDTRIFEKLIEKSTESSKAEAKKPKNVESIKLRPWESLGMEQPPEKPHTGSPALPKSPLKKSQSAESLKAEVCPWELETTDKAEICPWEAAASPSTTEKSRQDKDASANVSKSPSTSRDLCKRIVDSTSGKKKSSSRDHECVCTRESLGMELPPEKPHTGSPALPKSPSSKSQSAESLKAEVCPWEAQELEAAKDKAEICPWEAAATPPEQQRAKQGPGGGSKGDKRITRQAALASPVRSPEKGSSEREAVCPWESLGMELPPEKPHTGSPALPKSPSSKSQSAESLKAEVCPWEAQELESTNKAEICPWEVAASPSTTEKSRQDKDALSIASTSPSVSQGLRKIIVEGMSGKKKSSSRDHESVCPRESLGMELPPEKPRSGSPALPQSPSSKSQSTESLKAEVCPWELETTDKAEICPWEAAASPSTTEKSRQDKDASSNVSKSPSIGQGLRKKIVDSMTGKKGKASREHECVCPRESLGMEQPPEKPRSGSPALPKSPSSKSQSAESLKAEVCPWEAQHVESNDKAETCPWEVDAPLPEKGADVGKASLPPNKLGTSNPLERGSSEHKAICPRESLGMEELSLKAATGKEPSKKSEITESRKSDICPWEVAEATFSEEESCKAGVHPLGADGASPIVSRKSKGAAGASPVSATALLKKSKDGSDCKAQHKPLCRVLPGTEPPWGPRAEPRGASTAPAAGSGPSPSAGIAEVCPWEAEEDPSASDKTSRDPRKTSEVCPWEAQSVDLPPTLRGQGRAGASPQDGVRGGTETKPDVCPWVHE
ncbi:probable G-protein coupled receptor 179 [Athene cunicularia]|uniref:probable G-protein coupled receptor 179 n=1 Tax=Athene cunicularia TaxID=194338 RepID=UPI000EF6FB8F|nr:probable G-protein coupled receptor 179 [Athene cunicularia]